MTWKNLQCAGRLKWELSQLVTLLEGDPFDPLVFTEEEIVKVNAKEISGSLWKIVAGGSTGNHTPQVDPQHRRLVV